MAIIEIGGNNVWHSLALNFTVSLPAAAAAEERHVSCSVPLSLKFNKTFTGFRSGAEFELKTPPESKSKSRRQPQEPQVKCKHKARTRLGLQQQLEQQPRTCYLLIRGSRGFWLRK